MAAGLSCTGCRVGAQGGVSVNGLRARSVRCGRRSADRLLWQITRRAGRPVGLLGATALTLVSAETVLPAVMGRAVDAAFGHASRQWVVVCGLLVVVLVSADIVDDIAVGSVTAGATAWLRRTTASRVLSHGAQPDGSLSAGEVASRLVGSTSEASRIVPDVVRAVATVIPAVGSVVALALIDPWLLVTFVSVLPALTILLRRFARDSADSAAAYFAAQGTIVSRLLDALAGARTIAAAGTLEVELRRVLGPLPALRAHGAAMWRALRTIGAQEALLLPLLEVMVLAVGGVELSHGRLTVGELVAAQQYAALGAAYCATSPLLTKLGRARAGADRVQTLLDRAPVRYGTEHLPASGGQVELRRVSVTVGDRAVLDSVDLVVPPGALVALVGRSGAGKSMVASVLGRLIDPTAGAVLLDNVPLPQLTHAELRRAVTYAFERPSLFGPIVADAVGFGFDRQPHADVVSAAQAARADGFIRRLPQGYQTPLADTPLSGGEAQRLGIARAFAHAGRVLVLDDVAASLDTVTEREVSAALTGELADRARIIVSHRAAIAAQADLVVWLDAGRVRAAARHADLWSDEGYRSLFDAGASQETDTSAGGRT